MTVRELFKDIEFAKNLLEAKRIMADALVYALFDDVEFEDNEWSIDEAKKWLRYFLYKNQNPEILKELSEAFEL